MKISKRSIHYRLLKYFGHRDYEIPANLCGYFWYFVGSCVLQLLWRCVLTWVLITGPYIAWFTGELDYAFPTIVIGLSALVIGLLAAYYEFRPVSHVPKQPGIVRSYIKAKKQKLCPLIEFTE